MTGELAAYLTAQRQWSLLTFGEGKRTIGICKHIRKELIEIEADPDDLIEHVDVIMLAMDLFWRAGGDPENLLDMLKQKQNINFARTWPEPKPDDEPTEHIR